MAAMFAELLPWLIMRYLGEISYTEDRASRGRTGLGLAVLLRKAESNLCSAVCFLGAGPPLLQPPLRGLRQPVHHRAVGFPPRWWSTDLHPTQCRATRTPPTATSGVAHPGCEAFLTTAPVMTLRPAMAVLAAQQRLLDALDPSTDVVECLGRPTSPGRYFTDLIQLSYLIRRSWPLARDLVPTAALAQTLDEYIAGGHEQIADQCRRIGSDAGRQLHNEDRASPLDSVACAALLATADRLLALDTPRALTGHLRHLLSHDPRRLGRADWTRQFLTERPDSSEGLRQAVAPILQTYARTRRARSLRAPIRRTPFGPEHIAQFLQHDWHQRHLAGLDGIKPTHLRRTAALHLCQMAVGGSIRQAALRLGLPDTSAAVERCHSSARAVHRWAKQRLDPYEFETAVHELADELEASPHRIDYHQRRAALRGWCIDADTWACLVAQLPDSPWPHRREPELGDRKRHSASIIVWARITGGEHLFAPHPLRDQQPAALRNAWRLSAYAMVARFRDGCTRPHDIDLDGLLTAYGTWLAHHIDTTGTAAHEPWTESVYQPGASEPSA
jgi:hypothetical protein